MVSFSGGGLKFWLEAYSTSTQTNVSFTPKVLDANVSAVIKPKGTGALLASIPDGTATGGNARGAYAVDLQMARSDNQRVASGSYSVISGGYNNAIYPSGPFQGVYNVISGGTNNRMFGEAHSVISGGGNNTTGRNNTTIGGGDSNYVEGLVGTVAGGSSNSVSFNANYGAIGGGQSNTASGQWSTVAGGKQNTASNSYATVVGGNNNSVVGQFGFVGGGTGNYAAFTCDTIGGGESNVLGGQNNSNHRFIGGGQRNTINAEQTVGATICGGIGNTIYFGSAGAIICGGGYAGYPGGNFLSGSNSAIVGGQANRIGNGYGNYATYAFIGGGGGNIIDTNANASVISGGDNNIVRANVVGATITGGVRGAASLYCQQVHASGQFSANGDAQAHELIWRNAITGTTTTELFLDGAAVRAILPATNTVWKGIINIAAVCTNAGGGTTVVGDVAAIDYTVTVKRIAGNTVLVAAAANISPLDTDPSMATSAFVIAADNVNEALTISYTPPATADATTVIRVVATFRGLQIQY